MTWKTSSGKSSIGTMDEMKQATEVFARVLKEVV